MRTLYVMAARYVAPAIMLTALCAPSSSQSPASALASQAAADQAEALIADARTLRDGGDLNAAADKLGEAIEFQSRQLGPGHPDTLKTLEAQARLLRAASRFEESEALFRKGLSASERELGRDHPTTLTLLNRLASLLEARGQYEEAEKHYTSALEARERVLGKEHPYTQAVLFNLAGMYKTQGRFAEAEPLMLRLLETDERVNGAEHPDTLSSLHALGRLYDAQGQYREAEPIYLRTLEARGRVLGAEHLRTLNSANDLAVLYRKQGRLGDAEPLYDRVLAARTKAFGAANPRTLNAMNNLAMLYKEQGRFDESEALFTRALASWSEAENTDHPTALLTRGNLGELYRETERFDLSAQTYRATYEAEARVLGTDHPASLVTQSKLALVLAQMERFEDAEPLAINALDATERVFGKGHPRTLTAVHNLALLRLQQGDAEAAEPLFWRALAGRLAALPADHPDIAESYSAVGDIAFSRQSDPAKGVFFYKSAVNALQGVRQNMSGLDSATARAFIAKNRAIYLTLQERLISLGRFAEAEQIGRMIKDVEYTAYVRGASSDPSGETIAMTREERAWAAQLERWTDTPNAIAGELAALRAKRSEAGGLSPLEEKQFADLDEAFSSAYEQYFTLVSQWTSEEQDFDSRRIEREVEDLELEKSRAIQRLVGKIGPDVALLQAVAFEDSLHLFLVTGGAFVHEEVPVARAALFEAIFDARTVIDDGRDPGIATSEFRAEELQAPLGQLYEWLIAPIEDELEAAGTKTLMLNLQGQIRYLPFAALWDGEAYLTQRYELALYTPAANTRYEAPARLSQAQGFGLSKAVPGFSPLPGVPLELDYVIGTEEKPGVLDGQYRLDEGFTRISLEDGLSEPARVVHLATHFQIRPGDEASSYLLLGDGSRVSISTINRSYKYNFDGVELLTLSACETAVGAESTGMEIEGFGALAQNKGAASVVASLWQVSDTAAPRLMRSFYRGMVEANLSKSGALQRAQIEMIDSPEFADPFHWAPFVIMGNWR